MRRMSRHDEARPISEESEYLRDLARRIAAAYVAHTPVRAAVLVGSASTGKSDKYSDIDLGLLYDALPTEAQLAAARAQVIRDLVAQPFSGPVVSDWYRIDGVECQVSPGGACPRHGAPVSAFPPALVCTLAGPLSRA